MDNLKNCIQFKGEANIPCRSYEFPNFNDNEKYNPIEFKNYMKDKFMKPNYVFDENYVDKKRNSGKFKVNKQQMFVPKYASFHNNNQGVLIYHGLGSGKCHGINTPILMFDNSCTLVQDVKVGDKLKGEDEDSPMTVLSLGRGIDQMYEIISETGEKFTCNSEHILCLKLKKCSSSVLSKFVKIPDQIEITVKKFLKIPKHFRDMYCLFRNIIYHKTSESTKEINENGDTLFSELQKENTSDNGIFDKLKQNTKADKLKLFRHIFKLNKHRHTFTVNQGRINEFRNFINSVSYKCYIETDKNTKEITATVEENSLLKFSIKKLEIDNYYGFTLDKNHRYLLGNYIVTHNTCTSILVGESYKAFHEGKNLRHNPTDEDAFGEDRRIIVAVPPSIIQQFKEELYGKYKDGEYDGCVNNVTYDGKDIVYMDKPDVISTKLLEKLLESNSVIPSENKNTRGQGASIRKQNMKIQKKRVSESGKSDKELEIFKYWDIITHINFINKLVNRTDSNVVNAITKKLQKGGNLIIIDEIQNLISESGILYEKLINTIRLFSHNNKFVILSATPIYDKAFEIGLTMNLLNPRVYFPDNRKEFDKLFTDKSGKMINKDMFYWMSSGYVSYFSGGNPRSFPFKRIIEMNYPMGTEQETMYIKVLLNEVQKINFLEIESDKNDNKNYLSKVRQFSNIVFPGEGNENVKLDTPCIKLRRMSEFLTNTYDSIEQFRNQFNFFSV